ncbi:MAG: UDP-N-acetylmuramate--L-alanine ligase [Clostridia bacterium]|nr:UDP-N-acetylmuramate--L-alanine ligase [Clostridia bacterium]
MYTSYNISQLKDIFASPRSVYFIGIGGISMSSLAHIAHSMGMRVGGYDRTPSHLTRAFEADGIEVNYELDPSHIDGYDVIIYTAAISRDNPELARAIECDAAGEKYCVYRADFLGYLMSAHKNRIGVSGMHGKSTATSMIAHIFLAAELDPTIVSGAELSAIGGAYRIGAKDNFIMEACEYQDSFLSFTPNIAVVLNIDMDHPDYFADLDQIIGSFRRYLAIARDGYAVVNADCDNVRRACEGYTGTRITFGLKNPADFTACNITFDHGRAEFDIVKKGELLAHVKLSVTGRHNILNALASAAAADLCGVGADAIAHGLASFTGAKRRMELRGNVRGLSTGAVVPLYDDYAHHPTEIKATLSGALECGYERVFVVYQPHTYSRTYELFEEFSNSFDGVKLILADIYAAREENLFGVSSAQLAERIDGALYLPSFDEIAAYLRRTLTDGDMLIVMGAGDIIKLDELLL